MHYCGRDHQVQHWEHHKSFCDDVRIYRKALKTQKELLMDRTRPYDPFVQYHGFFGRIADTVQYLKAVFRLGYIAHIMCHQSATQFYLECCQKILSLSWTDPMEMRQPTPGLMLQLNMDQECYDFLKWYRTTCMELTYEWFNEDDYHNIKNANVFESVGYITDPRKFPIPLDLALDRYCPPRLTHVICMTILKTKLLTELIKLRFLNAKIFQTWRPDRRREKNDPRYTPEASRKEREKQCTSPIILASDELMNGGDVHPKMHELKKQVDALYKCVNDWNSHYWECLMEPKAEWFRSYRPLNRLGSLEEAHYAVLVTHAAWHTGHWTFSYIKMKHRDESQLDQYFAQYSHLSFPHRRYLVRN